MINDKNFVIQRNIIIIYETVYVNVDNVTSDEILLFIPFFYYDLHIYHRNICFYLDLGDPLYYDIIRD